ncbi:MAG: amidase [Pseudomonadota bacterium]
MSETASNQLTSALEAAARTEDKVHAYRHFLEQDARSSAAGADVNASTSPVFGWPFAVKEVFDVAGVHTSGGSRAYQDRVAAYDATVVARLRAAGCILLGTQIAHELTCGLDQPPTRNPWDLACYPGGSSAGAGVSVAVGSARFALGTDAAGSVRIPAAMTGTTGFKPTWGLISSHGVMREASAPSIDHVGIIARSAEDIAQILPILTNPDPWDAATLQARPGRSDATGDADQIAVLGSETRKALSDVTPLDPDIESAFTRACDVFHQAGTEIVDVELPSLPKAVDAIVTLFAAELSCANAQTVAKRRGLFAPAVADMIETGLAIPADRLEEAVKVRSSLRSELSAAFGSAGVHFLLTPTTPRPAMPLANFDPTEELGTLIPYTCGFNLTGNPAISVPCGQTAGGLPIGLQIVGRHFMDAALLDLARAFQQRTQWHELRPPV